MISYLVGLAEDASGCTPLGVLRYSFLVFAYASAFLGLLPHPTLTDTMRVWLTLRRFVIFTQCVFAAGLSDRSKDTVSALFRVILGVMQGFIMVWELWPHLLNFRDL